MGFRRSGLDKKGEIKYGNLAHDVKKIDNTVMTPEPIAKAIVSDFMGFQSKTKMALEKRKSVDLYDPFAGEGILGKVVVDLLGFRRNGGLIDHVCFCEIDEQRREKINALKIGMLYDDFMRFHTPSKFDLIISNPPFTPVEDVNKKVWEFDYTIIEKNGKRFKKYKRDEKGNKIKKYKINNNGQTQTEFHNGFLTYYRKMLESLKDEGWLVLICPDYFLNNSDERSREVFKNVWQLKILPKNAFGRPMHNFVLYANKKQSPGWRNFFLGVKE